MVLAEAVGIKWFERQFELPLRYDMLLDVGFASQEDKLRDSGVPYRFLFNVAGPARGAHDSEFRAFQADDTVGVRGARQGGAGQARG
jgi:hypothetical protein